MILLSSSIIAPFSYSFVLWGNAFAQESDPLGEGIGPPDEPPIIDQIAQRVEEVLEEIIEEPPPVVEELPPEEPITQEPVANVTTTEPIVNSTIKEPDVEQPITDTTGDKHATIFDENLVLSDDTTIIPEYNEIILDELISQTNNQTILFNETFILNDDSTESLSESIIDQLSVSFHETITITDKTTLDGLPQNHSLALPESISFSDNINTKQNGTSQTDLFDGITFVEDIIILLNNQTVQKIIPPEPKEESKTILNWVHI